MKKFMLVLLVVIPTSIWATVCCGEQDCRPDCPSYSIKVAQCVEVNKSDDKSTKEVELECRQILSGEVK